MEVSTDIAVRTINPDGRSPFVMLCDHASNRIPSQWADLGLPPSELVRHIAWDPGALAVCTRLSQMLDAPVVHSTVSRLVIDCNRDMDAPDLIPPISELTEIPGNQNVTADDRQRRIDFAHAPFHAAIDRLLDARQAAEQETILVCMHSFTPVYKGVSRPWEIGLIHARDQHYTKALRDVLMRQSPRLTIGWNEPYSALNGVTYTLEHHGDGRQLQATMIEIRNDEILTTPGVEIWAARLAYALPVAAEAVRPVLPQRPANGRSQPHA